MLKCDAFEVAKVLKVVSKAVAPGGVIPEYGYINMQVAKRSLAFAGFDGKLAIRMELPVNASDSGEYLLNGDKLIKYFALCDKPAGLEIKPTEKGVTFALDDGGRLNVARVVASAAFHKITMGQKLMPLDSDFFKASSVFLSAAGTDEAQPATTSSKVDFNSGVVWTTSTAVAGEYSLPNKLKGICVIIPNVFLGVLKSVHEAVSADLDLYSTTSVLTAATKDRSLALEHALPVFSYPDIGAMLKTYRNGLSWLSAVKSEFLTRFNRIVALASDTEKAFKISYTKSSLEMSYATADGSSATETMKCKSGSAGSVTFDYSVLKPFLDAAAKCNSDTVKIGFTSSAKGVVFDIGEPMLYVALPII